jgi:heme exporter protein CcmD
MGGYALYVWSAYALAAVILGGGIVWSAQCERRLMRELRARQAATSDHDAAP